VVGSLGIGYLLFRYFPDARGSGVPQTKARCTPVKARSLSAPWSESSFCTSQRSPVESRWGARAFCPGGCGIASVLGRRVGLSPEKVMALVPSEQQRQSRRRLIHRLPQYCFVGEIVGDLPRAGDWCGSIGLRDLLAGAPPPAWQQPSIQSSAIPNSSIRWNLSSTLVGRGRRSGFCGLHKTTAGHESSLPALPENDGLVPTVVGGLLVGF